MLTEFQQLVPARPPTAPTGSVETTARCAEGDDDELYEDLGRVVFHSACRAFNSYYGRIPAMAVRKWSVSIEEGLAGRVEEHVGPRGLSAFVARAVDRALERDQLERHLNELDEQFGEVPEELVERFDAEWPS